jgi:hypothetical protein
MKDPISMPAALPQTEIELIRAVGIHSLRAGCMTVANAWYWLRSFNKATSTAKKHIAMLRRHGSADAHLAAAAIAELLRRRGVAVPN